MTNLCTKDTRFVWIDLEMSGLNPDKDVILEIACVITNRELETIAQHEPIVIHQEPRVLDGMEKFVRDMHTKSGLLDSVQISTNSLAQAEQEILSFVQQYCASKKSPLCGNSIWVDRMFLRRYMPQFESYLHYRIVDVSSVKLLVNCWYGDGQQELFKKKKAHRAIEDIHESIAELKFYRENFFVTR